jgi:hypothetical protein
MNLSKQIEESFKLNKNPTNLSEMNLRLPRTKLSQKDFQFPKSPQETFSKRNPKKQSKLKKTKKLKKCFT